MSNFEKVKDSMKEIDRHDSLTLEDALGLFVDLCDDIKAGAAGTSIDRLPIAQPDIFFKNLTRSGRILLNVMQRKKAEIADVDADGRIKKQEIRLAESIDTLAGREREMDRLLADLEGQIDEEKKRQEACRLKMAQLEEKKRQLGVEESKCRTLQVEIDSFSKSVLEPLKRKQQDLLQRKEEVARQIAEEKQRLAAKEEAMLKETARLQQEKKQEFQRIQEKYALQKQASLEEVEKAKAECEAQRQASLEEVEKAKAECEAQRQASLEEVEKAKAECEAQKCAAEEELEKAQQECADCQQEFEKKKLEIETAKTQKEEERTKQEEELAQISDSIQSLEDAIQAGDEEKKEKEKNIILLEEEQRKLAADVLVLQEDIERLNEHLEHSDAVKLREERDFLVRQKQEMDKNVMEAERKRDEARAELEGRQKELEGIRDQNAREKSRLLDQNLQLQNMIEVLKKENEHYREEEVRLKKKQEEMWTEAQEAEDVCRKLRAWFQSLEAEKYGQRLKAAEAKKEQFMIVQKELFREMTEDGMTFGMSNQAANEKREELRQQMGALERQVDKYRRTYDMICRALSS